MTTKAKVGLQVLSAVGYGGFIVLCCGALLALGGLGAGAILAALTSWWVLLPVAVAVGAWYAYRRSCRIAARRQLISGSELGQKAVTHGND